MSGLSTRQTFAAAALQGCYAGRSEPTGEHEIAVAERYARIAVRAADALIAELTKNENTWCSVCGGYHQAPLCRDDDLPEPAEIRETGR